MEQIEIYPDMSTGIKKSFGLQVKYWIFIIFVIIVKILLTSHTIGVMYDMSYWMAFKLVINYAKTTLVILISVLLIASIVDLFLAYNLIKKKLIKVIMNEDGIAYSFKGKQIFYEWNRYDGFFLTVFKPFIFKIIKTRKVPIHFFFDKNKLEENIDNFKKNLKISHEI